MNLCASSYSITAQKTGRALCEQLLTPFEITFRYYCHAEYRSFFAFYGAEKIPGEEYASTTEEIEKSARDYLNFILGL
jgi:putative NADPH-quinone reductase